MQLLFTGNQIKNNLSKMCSFIQKGDAQLRNEKKQRFCILFRKFILEFINNYIIFQLDKCHEIWNLVACLIQKWEHFKRFCQFYIFLFKRNEDHYQNVYKRYDNQYKRNKVQDITSIYPIPVIAIHYFSTHIYQRFKQQITGIICHMISEQRFGQPVERQTLKSLLEIVYSCGLSQLARLDTLKRENNQSSYYFYPTLNKQIEKYYCSLKNPDDKFMENILDKLLEDSKQYYKQLFEKKISCLGPYEDFSMISQIIQRQQEMANTYFFTNFQKGCYLNSIKQVLIGTDLYNRLTKQYSLKYCLEKFNEKSQDYLNQIQLFIQTSLKLKSKAIKVLETIISEFILEAGSKINEKLQKRRQHIGQMVNLKKSVNRVLQITAQKDLSIYIVKDKCLRKVLQSIQASRNLADFLDFKIKQSIKNKGTQSQVYEKIKDVFLILENLVATDSFLIYHQQYLGRRLLQPIHQPRIDIQKYVLRKIGEQLGNVTINAHSFMIRDIEKSLQVSETFSKKLPFARFKWSCRIISPQFWYDSILNNNIQMLLPQALRLQSEAIKGFYYEQFGRYVSWKIDKGYSLFEGIFRNGKYRFQCENIYMVLLFHISEGEGRKIFFWELQKKITKQKQGNANYLLKCLKVLIENGLIKSSSMENTERVTQSDVLSLQVEYKAPPTHKPNQTIMIKPSNQVMKSLQQINVDHSKIAKEREKVIEAVLVKLLKHSHSTGNNKMSLQQLMKGVREYQYLRKFEISDLMIKQRLEQIIARGYCERDQQDRKIYHYKA